MIGEKSPFVLIEDAPASRVIVARREDSGVAYASRGAIVEQFKYCAAFHNASAGGIVVARDAAMRWIRQETDRLAGNAEREREAGS